MSPVLNCNTGRGLCLPHPSVCASLNSTHLVSHQLCSYRLHSKAESVRHIRLHLCTCLVETMVATRHVQRCRRICPSHSPTPLYMPCCNHGFRLVSPDSPGICPELHIAITMQRPCCTIFREIHWTSSCDFLWVFRFCFENVSPHAELHSGRPRLYPWHARPTCRIKH